MYNVTVQISASLSEVYAAFTAVGSHSGHVSVYLHKHECLLPVHMSVMSASSSFLNGIHVSRGHIKLCCIMGCDSSIYLSTFLALHPYIHLLSSEPTIMDKPDPRKYIGPICVEYCHADSGLGEAQFK